MISHEYGFENLKREYLKLILVFIFTQFRSTPEDFDIETGGPACPLLRFTGFIETKRHSNVKEKSI